MKAKVACIRILAALPLVLMLSMNQPGFASSVREGVELSLGGNTGTHDNAWSVAEDALIGPDNRQLTRLPGHIAYWFAWAGYLGEDGQLGG